MAPERRHERRLRERTRPGGLTLGEIQRPRRFDLARASPGDLRGVRGAVVAGRRPRGARGGLLGCGAQGRLETWTTLVSEGTKDVTLESGRQQWHRSGIRIGSEGGLDVSKDRFTCDRHAVTVVALANTSLDDSVRALLLWTRTTLRADITGGPVSWRKVSSGGRLRRRHQAGSSESPWPTAAARALAQRGVRQACRSRRWLRDAGAQ